MKTQRNIFLAFILNLSFAIFELFGGFWTGSVAILSDAIHDAGDCISIGISFILEKISKKKPNDKYTYGYLRYSVLGGVITTSILIIGSCIVIYNAILRIITPTQINYNGMIIFAVIGTIINLFAAIFTRGGDSINERAVNLHMLEDVLGWIVVLIGAIIMKFTNISVIDPILSICVASLILITSLKNFKKIIDLFLEKTPDGILVESIKNKLCSIEGVENVHHVHVRSIDGYHNYATMHVVIKERAGSDIKKEIRHTLEELDIQHATIETENETEGSVCEHKCCDLDPILSHNQPHHHHGHHH